MFSRLKLPFFRNIKGMRRSTILLSSALFTGNSFFLYVEMSLYSVQCTVYLQCTSHGVQVQNDCLMSKNVYLAIAYLLKNEYPQFTCPKMQGCVIPDPDPDPTRVFNS